MKETQMETVLMPKGFLDGLRQTLPHMTGPLNVGQAAAMMAALGQCSVIEPDEGVPKGE